MAGETPLTIVGNLTADPELRFTASGVAVANFTVASTPRTFNRNTNEWEDGEALFMRCSLWREPGENTAESLTKGTRVIVQGNLVQRSYEDRDGNNRTVVELEVTEIGPSLRYATAKVTRNARNSGGNGGGNRGGDNSNDNQDEGNGGGNSRSGGQRSNSGNSGGSRSNGNSRGGGKPAQRRSNTEDSDF